MRAPIAAIRFGAPLPDRETVGVMTPSGPHLNRIHHRDRRPGRPGSPRTRSIEDVLERCLVSLGVPVLYKLPLGHGKHLATIPLGIKATLDADARTLTIDEPGVRARS